MALIFMAEVSPLSAQEGEIIESLKIVGNKRIDESTILYYIQSKPGTVLSKSKIELKSGITIAPVTCPSKCLIFSLIWFNICFPDKSSYISSLLPTRACIGVYKIALPV